MSEEETLDYILSTLKSQPNNVFILEADFQKLVSKVQRHELPHFMGILDSDKNVEIQKLPTGYRISPRGNKFNGYVKQKQNRNLWKWVARVGIIVGAITGIISVWPLKCSPEQKIKTPTEAVSHQSQSKAENHQKADSANEMYDP